MSERDLLLRTAEIAADFLESLDTRRVYPEESIEELGHALGGPLPAGPSDPLDVIEQLARDAGRGVVASPSGRYFGFVIGGALPSGAAYFADAGEGPRDPFDWTPEASRRARGFTVYAVLKSLGSDGVAELVERCCARAARFAAAVSRLPGCTVLNDVVLNQVLFRFEDDEATAAVLADVQASGHAWMGGTTWRGRSAIRLSVSNWRTTEDDIDRTVDAFEAAAAATQSSPAA